MLVSSQPPSTRLRAPRRRRDRRAEEEPVAEQLGLHLLLEQHPRLEGVPRGKAHAPGRRRAAARDRDDHPPERAEVELEPAVALRDEHVVEARLEERLVDLLRVVGALLRLGLELDQARTQLVGARDQLGDGRGHRALLSRSVASRSTRRPSGSRSGSPATTTP